MASFWPWSEEAPREKNLRIRDVGKELEGSADFITQTLLGDRAFKSFKKEQAKKDKAGKDAPSAQGEEDVRLHPQGPGVMYVINFEGDTEATAVDDVRALIDVILQVADPKKDEVMVRVDSGGGYVTAYGSATAQLQRIRAAGIRLVVCVDEIAASGGYMMACMADVLLANPFAMVGSIGVRIDMLNFHARLKKEGVEYLELAAGEHKIGVSMFGEASPAKRKQEQKELDAIHTQFKDHVLTLRPEVAKLKKVDMARVFSGETFSGLLGKDLGLVDGLIDSDTYVLDTIAEGWTVYELEMAEKQPFWDRMSDKFFSKVVDKLSSIFTSSSRRIPTARV